MIIRSGIGDRIKEIRKSKGLTQKKLADELGVSAQVVSNWEREYSYPDNDDLLKLSNFSNCPIDYILKGDYIVENERLNLSHQFTLQEVDIEDFFMEEVDFYYKNQKLSDSDINKILKMIDVMLSKK
ncbi:helix-turn-helix transcriptional regulator [Exiguobacterium sp.]|uniref:helix-turn-helix domain-containing protein n=1 Tax=Exiguobacterium sp. TaxID=44751 RepID=UPI00257CB99B|nr:helix-turn-helix transcriptional regulator [Exiguobacterium sp.]